MVLPLFQLVQQLNHKKAEFLSYDTALAQVRQAYQQALKTWQQQTIADITAAIDPQIPDWGARPIEPWHQGWRIPLGVQWPHRQAAREWAMTQLMDVTTVAVDGSQIVPSEELFLPVGVVQAGWFLNPHRRDRPYAKEIVLELITPAELRQAEEQLRQPQIYRFHERYIHLRRFELELKTLQERMAEVTAPALLLFDGSFVATFAESYAPEWQRRYVAALCQTLAASRQHQIPLVAYIDSSQARDLVTLLGHLEQLAPSPHLSDAQLLSTVLTQWGDRSPVFICDRGGILENYGAWVKGIGFCYLKAHQGYPVRLELPLWLYEAGLLDQVIRWLCGELITGQGYPYALEAADQLAVLQGSDRQAFLKQLQVWAEGVGMELRFSRKWVSKQQRR
ncbi:DNA double-strand break repair nuclease NurA [Thermosynechococcus sp. PP45]|uniref:DNA double-strand break repair nuclease NurA n=1 Tax=unclassified Thermosynechococcus TaxID=2622553 RepID=UPI0026718AD7|nr:MULTISPECIES: DNA double-strand break repair nuclease NurA [unclassified Thermosynechococcus]WKT81595.1 DNA double-strand break repair nuclease NurA [Thermosynechococcus sp. PP45]WNC25207.1 DNA double-strand break repair nuclease NurA [Thermosynechococcus sp. PP551]WNC27785.1 DNA double-strand break repair nuclease NurA [Thermosynechococcus sp. PP555]